MPIVAEVFHHARGGTLGRFSFEVGPQSGDQLLIGNDSFRVVRCRHLAVNSPSGEANMQYQVLVDDA